MAQSRGYHPLSGFGKKGAKGKQNFKPIQDPWEPVTKLGRLVKQGKINKLQHIFKFSIPIKCNFYSQEHQIVQHILGPNLKQQVMQVKPVQKQTQAGQRTRFKSHVIVGDGKNFLGLGWKVHKQVQGAIKGAIIMARLNLIPIRKGYWGNRIGQTHTVPCKVTGKTGSVKVRLIPAPKGTGLVAPPVSKRVLQFSGLEDVYTKTQGKTRTKSNFIKATYAALQKTYRYLNPDFWGKTTMQKHPFEQFGDILKDFLKNKQK